tara:strand:- start:531 stop:728 length:198 start_codon:yes stop_codon:yes gene_type:complete
MTVTYDRVECYRSERVAKFFAERSNGTYIGFVKKPTSYTIINNTYQDVQAGSYVVVWEKEKCNLN